MLRRFFFLIAFIFTTILASAEIEVNCGANSVYVGESFEVDIVRDGEGDEPKPEFCDLDESCVSFHSSDVSSQHFVQIINGVRTERGGTKRTFRYLITAPNKAGNFSLGRIKVGDESAMGPSIVVVGESDESVAFVTLECEEGAVLVNNPFSVLCKIYLRALDGDYAKEEPILASSPLSLSVPFLGDDDVLKVDDEEGLLRRLIADDGCFSINGISGGGFFGPQLLRFKLPSSLVKREGMFWEYTFRMSITPQKSGTFTLSPVSVKGQIIDNIVEKTDVFGRRQLSAVPKRVYAISPKLDVVVEAPPMEGRPESFVGTTGKGMAARASIDFLKCNVGDPLMLSIEVTGDISLVNLHAPSIALKGEDAKNFRIYDDAEVEEILGGKLFKFRMRPLKAGTIEFPSIPLAYYDSVKREYVVVHTEPLPLQVGEATLISALEDSEEEAMERMPDGIMHGASDEVSRYFGAGLRLYYLLVFPLVWGIIALLMRFVPVLITWLRSSTPKSKAKAALLQLERCNGDVGAASNYGRCVIAAYLGDSANAKTRDELYKDLVEHSIAEADAREICDAFDALDQVAYSGGGADVGDAAVLRLSSALRKLALKMKVLLVVFGIFIFGYEVVAEEPPSFEWERAEQAMASGYEKEDFFEAAKLYYAMVTNGAQSGSLYYNLGVSLALAEEKECAKVAFLAAERRMGTLIEIENGLKIVCDESGDGNEISRIFFPFHYRLSFARRQDAAIVAFCAIWCFLILRTLLSRTSLHKVRKLLMTLSIISAVATVALTLSVASTLANEKNVVLPFPVEEEVK